MISPISLLLANFFGSWWYHINPRLISSWPSCVYPLHVYLQHFFRIKWIKTQRGAGKPNHGITIAAHSHFFKIAGSKPAINPAGLKWSLSRRLVHACPDKGRCHSILWTVDSSTIHDLEPEVRCFSLFYSSAQNFIESLWAPPQLLVIHENAAFSYLHIQKDKEKNKSKDWP